MTCTSCGKPQKLSPLEKRIARRILNGLPTDDLVLQLEVTETESTNSEAKESIYEGSKSGNVEATIQSTLPDESSGDNKSKAE